MDPSRLMQTVFCGTLKCVATTAIVVLDMRDGLEEGIYGCNPFLGESFCNLVVCR